LTSATSSVTVGLMERNGELTRLRTELDNPERRMWLNENVDVCVDGSAVTNKRS